jgi:hypothetical protein
MEQTRKHFTQDYLVQTIREAIRQKLEVSTQHKATAAKWITATLDSLLSALAMFSFKFPSLLQFDQACRGKIVNKIKAEEELDVETDGEILKKGSETEETTDTEEKIEEEEKLEGVEEVRRLNLQELFGIHRVPCDTTMREVLDPISPSVLRPAYTAIFALLQRGKVLEYFLFLEKYYIISIDGTGVFCSSKIHCKNCCVKEHRDGHKTYYHQMLTAALVHPDQKVVFPFAPEPIMNTDGTEKNDCERSALKRWIKDFRREHPHLPVVIVADGLSSNAPFIETLREYNCHFILVCRDADHTYLTKWVNDADREDAPIFEATSPKGVQVTHQYMKDAPLNESNKECLVNVVKYWETDPQTKIQTKKWMWVTDLPVNRSNVHQIAKGGRSRWKIENETFNTLKNQGYQFEHNFGHGYKNLTTVLAFLMLLAFFVDQCLQRLNKRFQEVYAKCGAKYVVWERMRGSLSTFRLPSFESLYESIIRPPPAIRLPACA